MPVSLRCPEFFSKNRFFQKIVIALIAVFNKSIHSIIKK